MDHLNNGISLFYGYCICLLKPANSSSLKLSKSCSYFCMNSVSFCMWYFTEARSLLYFLLHFVYLYNVIRARLQNWKTRMFLFILLSFISNILCFVVKTVAIKIVVIIIIKRKQRRVRDLLYNYGDLALFKVNNSACIY